ncbi:MAG: ATP-binding cassette domain-containing protein [Planctomycetota bacterium]
MPLVDVQRLSKTFYVHKKEPGLLGSVRALLRRETIAKEAVREATFQIGEGEIVGLVGANGAGKTTIVKMLAGIVHPTSGDAQVLGHRPWQRDNRLRRQMALIMGQKAQLWWDLPAADCFLLLKEIYQIPDERYHKTLQDLAERLEVTQELTVQVRRLSLGERMKMELIAALLHQPKIVYLDEPTIGLDLTAQRTIRDFLLEYQREHRPAMILTSHYMEDIERLCQRIMIIRTGDIVYDGPLAEIATKYAQHKVVTAHLQRRGANERPSAVELARLGEVLQYDDSCVRIRMPRAEVAEGAAHILRRLSVADLAIEDVDIGTIIEQLIKARAQTGADA